MNSFSLDSLESIDFVKIFVTLTEKLLNQVFLWSYERITSVNNIIMSSFSLDSMNQEIS